MSPALFAAACLATGAVSLFASAAWLRSGAYCCLVAAMLALWWFSLGLPRPALFGTPSGTVMAFSLNEPTSIYVQVRPKSGGVPVTWALPWNEGDAEALVRADLAAKKLGRALAIKGRPGGGRGYETQHKAGAVFYPAPAPPSPAKRRP